MGKRTSPGGSTSSEEQLERSHPTSIIAGCRWKVPSNGTWTQLLFTVLLEGLHAKTILQELKAVVDSLETSIHEDTTIEPPYFQAEAEGLIRMLCTSDRINTGPEVSNGVDQAQMLEL